MVSDLLKASLEAEIVGQPAAIQAVVRGTVHVMSGLTPRERKWAALLFIGPSGTGKSQLVQSLARAIHGDGPGLYVADCTHYVHADPWTAFAAQLVPMFSSPSVNDAGMVLEAPPLSILLVESLDRARKEVATALAASLETGRLALPGGRMGSLRHCLVFLTTSLCARELLEEVPRIGFQAPATGDEEEDGRVFRACLAHAEESFGEDLVGHLDGLLVFHKLDERHLAEILERRFARLNRSLRRRGFRAEMTSAARAFLLARGCGDLRTGARELVRAHRRFIEFPLADMLVSGRIPEGGLVLVDRHEGDKHLHFTVSRDAAPELLPPDAACVEIAVS
jgi:ATP-dependent Clp protease ATP-binding subunit ClpC